MLKIKSMLLTFIIANAILSTLEDYPQGMPESTLYLALGSNYNLSTKLTAMLIKAQAIQVTGHYITKGSKFDESYKNSKEGEQKIRELCAAKGIAI